jgi:hypothetical protein
MGVGGQCHDLATFSPGMTQYPLYRRLGGPQGWAEWARKTLLHTGMGSPFHPARSKSLYLLSYPSPCSFKVVRKNTSILRVIMAYWLTNESSYTGFQIFVLFCHNLTSFHTICLSFSDWH